MSLTSRICLALFGLAAASGCRQADGRPEAHAPARPRVVSLHDVTTELVVALGGTDRLVGVGGAVQLPPEVAAALVHIPRVDGAESIVAAAPSVVLGTRAVAERSPELVSFLRERGIEVWLAQPHTLDDVLALVPEVGRRLNVSAAASSLLQRLRARVAAAPPDAAPLPVFVYDCCDPAFTAGGGAVLSDLIARAGGRNVFADLAADWTKVSWEQVLARRPRLIVIHDYQFEGQADVAEKRRRLSALRGLSGIPITVMPLGYALGGLRSVDGLEHLGRAIAGVREAG